MRRSHDQGLSFKRKQIQISDRSNQGGRAANSDSSTGGWCSHRYPDQENSPRDNRSFNLAAGRRHRIYHWRTHQATNVQQPWYRRKTTPYRNFTSENRAKPLEYGTHFIHSYAHRLEDQVFPSTTRIRSSSVRTSIPTGVGSFRCGS